MPELNEEVVYASYLVKFRPKAEIIDNQILGIFVESEVYKEHVRAHAGGAAQPNANAQVLGSAKLNVPPPTLQIQFKEFVEPIFEQKSFLEKANFSLAKARDILLPKLMSGEIAV
jgi:type I restriction enzyme S subunit